MPSIRVTAALAIFLTGFTFATAQAAPTGTWLTEKGDAHILAGAFARSWACASSP